MKDTVIDPEWDINKSTDGEIVDGSLKTGNVQGDSKEKAIDLASPEAHDPFAHSEPGLMGDVWDYLGSLLSGNILSKAEVKRLYPYFVFIAFLTILYISNIFSMQSSYRRYDHLSKEIKELRAESITIASERMNATRQSRILEEANARGLDIRESVIPPKVVK